MEDIEVQVTDPEVIEVRDEIVCALENQSDLIASVTRRPDGTGERRPQIQIDSNGDIEYQVEEGGKKFTLQIYKG